MIRHDALYSDRLTALGGPCKPEIVGWCALAVDGFVRNALIVTQAWPFLPLGTDPRHVIAAKKYVAVIPAGEGFRCIEIPSPELSHDTGAK